MALYFLEVTTRLGSLLKVVFELCQLGSRKLRHPQAPRPDCTARMDLRWITWHKQEATIQSALHCIFTLAIITTATKRLNELSDQVTTAVFGFAKRQVNVSPYGLAYRRRFSPRILQACVGRYKGANLLFASTLSV